MAESMTSIPPVPEGQGRIFFYRTTALGAAIQPPVKLNGQKVGIAKPRGAFFVDRAPGNYEVETSTEVKRKLSFVLEPQQVRYVRLQIGMGFFVGHVWGELVEPSAGEPEVAKCHLMKPGADE